MWEGGQGPPCTVETRLSCSASLMESGMDQHLLTSSGGCCITQQPRPHAPPGARPVEIEMERKAVYI